MYLQSIFVGLVACLFTVMVTLLLGTILKKTVLTISAVGAFTLLISTEKLSNVLNNLFGILPINVIDCFETLRRPYMYSIFGMKILRGYVTPIVLLVICIMIIPLVLGYI